MKKLPITLFVLSASTMLVGCVADEHQDIKQWMQEASKTIKGKIPPLPEITPFPIVSYEAADQMDPFNSLRMETGKKGEGSGLRPDPNRYKEPLEAYPLESLKMVGVIHEKGRTSAMVLADKSVHTVRLGSYMGQNFGMVVGITDMEIQLKELVQDQDSEWVERATSLQLQEQEIKK
jgi:type IV pilus assembly protein PilP